MTKTLKITEKYVLDLLRQRHVRDGNGGSGEYAFMTHVRNAAGFNSGRTFDAVVMNLWPSRGLFLHAFEVKCSRSDWLRELKQPEKADAAFRLVDQFSVVAGPDIVKEGELPPTWGLLVVHGSQLRCVKEAPLFHERNGTKYPPVDRQFVVAMLRAGGAVPKADSQEVMLARAEGRWAGLDQMQRLVDDTKVEYDKVNGVIREFENASGVSLRQRWASEPGLKAIAAAVRAVMEGDKRIEQQRARLERVRDDLRAAADDIDRYVAVPSEGTDA